MIHSPEWVKFMRERYPHGTRIRLQEMNDPYSPVPAGTEGTVECVDDACQIHMKWDNGRTLALIPGVDSFSVIVPKLTQLKLYMPLTAKLYERDDYGNMQEDPTDVDGQDLLGYEDKIFTLIERREMLEGDERGLMTWYGEKDAVDDKVVSLRPTVEVVEDKLMGVAVCMVMGELTPEELVTLKEYVAGQMSDGWGEGFEQWEIKAEEGELYVSFWNSGDGWTIQTGEELSQSQRQSGTPQMGGMELG